MKKLVMLVAAVMAVAFVGLNYERIAYANDRSIPSIGVSGGTDSISVVWSAPAEAPYDYRLAWGLEGGYIGYASSNTSTAGNAYPGGSATSYTITGLDPGTYNVKLKARYDGSAGPWKAASSVRVEGDAPPVVVVVPDPTAEPTAEPEPPTSEQQEEEPPTAPTGLTASQVAHDSVTLTWTAPAEAPHDYRLAWGLEGGYIGYAASNTTTAGNAYPGGSATSYTITGLDPGTYSVKLRARYDGSAGPWKAASSVVVTGDASPVVVVVPDPTAEPEPPTSEQQQDEPPAAPTGLRASQVAHDSVTLTWTAPSSGSTVTGYKVLRGTDADSLSAIVEDTGSAGTEYTDSNVAAETAYFYAVLALSADGDGAQSAALSVTTPAARQPPVVKESATGAKKPPPTNENANEGAESSRGVSVVLEAPSWTVVVGSAGGVIARMAGFDVFDDPDGAEYTYRIDLLDSDGNDVDSCEGDGMGEAVRIFKDEFAWIFVRIGSTEARVGHISSSCAAGSYTVRASVLDTADTEVASAWRGFRILAPAQARQTATATATPAALTSLKLQFAGHSGFVALNETFSATTTNYTADVPEGVTGTAIVTPVWEVSNPVTWSQGAPQLVKGAYVMYPLGRTNRKVGLLAIDADGSRAGWQGAVKPGTTRSKIVLRVMTGPATLPATSTSDTNTYPTGFSWHKPHINTAGNLPCLQEDVWSKGAIGPWSGGCRNFTGTTFTDYTITLSYQYPESRGRTNVAPNRDCLTTTVPMPGAPQVYVSRLYSPGVGWPTHHLAFGLSKPSLVANASALPYYDSPPPDNTCNNVRSVQIWYSTDRATLAAAIADSTGGSGANSGKHLARAHANVRGWEYDLGTKYYGGYSFGYIGNIDMSCCVYVPDVARPAPPTVYYAARANFDRLQTDTASGRVISETEDARLAGLFWPGAWTAIKGYKLGMMEIAGTARVGKTITVNWGHVAIPEVRYTKSGHGHAWIHPSVHWYRTDGAGIKTRFKKQSLGEIAREYRSYGVGQAYARHTLTAADVGFKISAELIFQNEYRFSPLTGTVVTR